MNHSSSIHVYFILILIQVLFGINFPASKVIVTYIDPILWSNIRFIISGILLMLITILCKRPHPVINKEFIFGILSLSILGMGLGQGLFLVGLKFTTSINSAVIITSIPILTLLIVVLRGQESLSFLRIIGFISAFLGVLFMRDLSNISFSNQTLIGDLFVFVAAFCFALYLSLGKSFFIKYDNMWSTAWMFLVAGLLMLPFNVFKFQSLNEVDFNQTLISCCLFSIIGATLLTYYLNNWALKRVSSGLVAIFIYLQPIVAGLISYFFLDEEVTFRLIICSMLILTGLVLTILEAIRLQKSFERKTN